MSAVPPPLHPTSAPAVVEQKRQKKIIQETAPES
jgi:hypothetical protein